MTNSSIFTQFGCDLLEKKNVVFPMKDHPQVPFILDTLSRLERHHLALLTTCSEKMNLALLETVAHAVSSGNASKSLRDCYFIHFDIVAFSRGNLSEKQISNDFQALSEGLRLNNKRVILSISQSHFLRANESELQLLYFKRALMSVLPHDVWRIIIFTHPKEEAAITELHDYFSIANMIHPDTQEILALLKSYRAQLENFHHVVISDETIASAYTLASHYLPGQSCFDKTLELLDSAAARANTLERNEPATHKAIVSSHLLAQVISSWTRIPLPHLQHNKVQVQKFVETIQKQIFGQDIAINFIASLLQNACINLQGNTGALCSFLFVGPADTGKKSMAYAIAEHLFGHKNALLHVNFNKAHYQSLDQIKVYSHNHDYRQSTLFSAIHATPYAVVLIEHIDLIPKHTLDLFEDIFTQGFAFDAHGNKYDFRNAIIIGTTCFASDYFSHVHDAEPTQETSKAVDLMDLVLNEHVQEHSTQTTTHLSPQELCDELVPRLAHCFSSAFLHNVHAVPFMSLDYSAFEKIIRAKLKNLAQRLTTHFGIELSYAPEIIKFLAHEAFWRKATTKSLDNLLSQHLYSCVAHEILLHAEDKNRSKRLLIQLNDTGQLLRCEFITANEANLYNI